MPNLFTRTAVALAYKLNPAWLGFASYSDVPQAIRMAHNYKTYAKEGYKNSDTLYKCISYLIRNGSAIPPVLYTDTTRQKRIEKHPLLDKLNKPNPEQSGVAYREAVLGYKLLAGNSFQYSIREGRVGPPDELWTLRPDKVQILIKPRVGVVGYKHEDMDTQIDPANVGHTKYWNPDDDNETGMGMSPVEAASLNIDMQIAGKKWNLGLLQNGARPPGIWKVPTLMGQNERQKLEDKLNEKFAGAKSAGKSPLFDGGLDWKGTGLAPAQMDYLDSLKYNGGSIANILNMAPQLVGDTGASTYDNMKQAKVWSYTEGIFPELDDLYALWNNWLIPMYPDLFQSGAYLYYDKESVEVIQELIQAQKDSQSARANELWTTGVAMLNEARELAGLPETPGGNVFRIGAILVPQDKLADYAEQSLTTPAAPPPAQPEPLQGPVPTLALPAPTTEKPEGEQPNDRPSDTPEPVPGPAGGSGVDAGKSRTARPDTRRVVAQTLATKALDLVTEAERKAYAQSFEQARETWYTEAETRLQTYFAQEQNMVVAAVKRAALPGSASDRAEHALKSQQLAFERLLLALYQDVAQDIGAQILKELQDADTSSTQKAASRSASILTRDSIAYLTTLAGTQITNIDETTLADIQAQLAQGVAAGESIPALSKRIDGLYLDQIIPNRSKTIARTEVLSASSYAAIQAAKQSGLTLNKVWLATEDARTRPDHAAADGQTVGMDETFTVGGVAMDRPGDSSAGAAQVVNCRCTVYFKRVEKQADTSGDDSEKRARTQAYRELMGVALK